MSHQAFSLLIHRPDPGQLWLCARGPLTAGHGAERQAWTDVFRASERASESMALQLDLSGVTRIDAAGLGLIAELCGALHRQGGCVHLTGVSERVGTLLRVSGVGRLFDQPATPATARVTPFRSRSMKFCGAGMTRSPRAACVHAAR